MSLVRRGNEEYEVALAAQDGYDGSGALHVGRTRRAHLSSSLEPWAWGACGWWPSRAAAVLLPAGVVLASLAATPPLPSLRFFHLAAYRYRDVTVTDLVIDAWTIIFSMIGLRSCMRLQLYVTC